MNLRAENINPELFTINLLHTPASQAKELYICILKCALFARHQGAKWISSVPPSAIILGAKSHSWLCSTLFSLWHFTSLHQPRSASLFSLWLSPSATNVKPLLTFIKKILQHTFRDPLNIQRQRCVRNNILKFYLHAATPLRSCAKNNGQFAERAAVAQNFCLLLFTTVWPMLSQLCRGKSRRYRAAVPEPLGSHISSTNKFLHP